MTTEREDNLIKEIIRDIESSKYSCKMIMDKYELTSYKYYQILKETGIKNKFKGPKRGPKGPRNTVFKKLLQQSDGGIENDTDIEIFLKDCKDGMKLSDLMDKYKLSLYQIRELRKKYKSS